MVRYLRLFGYFVNFSLSRAMEFRLDFFFRIIMDLLYYGVNIAFYRLIFLNTPLLGGWNESQMMIFVSAYLLVDAINMTLFSNNTWWLPYFINRGDLDYYLVRPVSSLFFLSLRDFAVNSFINFIMDCGIMIWAFHQYPEPLSVGKILLFLALVLNGSFLYHLIRMMTIIPVFWTHSGRGFDQIFYSFGKSMERPDRIFRGWVRRFFTIIFPFSLMASFPARLILERFSWSTFLHLLLVTIGFFIGVVWFWKSGLKAYSSASS